MERRVGKWMVFLYQVFSPGISPPDGSTLRRSDTDTHSKSLNMNRRLWSMKSMNTFHSMNPRITLRTPLRDDRRYAAQRIPQDKKTWSDIYFRIVQVLSSSELLLREYVLAGYLYDSASYFALCSHRLDHDHDTPTLRLMSTDARISL